MPGPGQTLTLSGGAEMPMLGLGTWQLTGREAYEGVRHALELGYWMIDTSGDYGNQPEIGRALRDFGRGSDQVFLVTKVEENEDAYASAREKLAELAVERVDLCLLHRPPPEGIGEELWEGLIRARSEGLAREIGVSNYSPSQLDLLSQRTGVLPAVNQIEWTPFGHSEEVLTHARERGIVIQAYSPLTRGERLDDPTLRSIGREHGKTAAQVLLRWCIELGCPPLPKAASSGHREQNADVFDFELSADEIGALSTLNEGWSSLAGLPYV